MAKVIAVAVKDTCTGEFLTPFYVHNNDEAARAFKHMLTTNEIWEDNKEQFELYALGVLDTKTGNITSIEPMPDGTNAVTHPDLLYKGNDILS